MNSIHQVGFPRKWHGGVIKICVVCVFELINASSFEVLNGFQAVWGFDLRVDVFWGMGRK